MNDIGTLHTEIAEGETWLAMYACAPPAVREQLGIDCTRVGSVYAFRMRALDALQFNRAIWVAPTVDAAIVDDVCRWYAAAGTPRFQLQLGAASIAQEVADVVRARGGVETDAPWAKFASPTAGAKPPPGGMRIEPVDATTRMHYAQATRMAFGMPPVFDVWLAAFAGLPDAHAFLGWQNGEPAAAGLWYRHGDTAWLGLGATVPAYRGRGWQPAVLQQRIHHAARCGCTVATSETGRLPNVANPSYDNLVSALELRYLRRSFLFTNH
jgi:GNAT superfamily N-acetyltransferase